MTFSPENLDVIFVFVMNREDVKFLTKSRQNDVAIRDQKTCLFLFNVTYRQFISKRCVG